MPTGTPAMAAITRALDFSFGGLRLPFSVQASRRGLAGAQACLFDRCAEQAR
jgi:hypothetical protein